MIQATVYLLIVRPSFLSQFLASTYPLYAEENLVVKKVGLFATVFQRYDGTETYYFNSQLFTKFVYAISALGSSMFAFISLDPAVSMFDEVATHGRTSLCKYHGRPR